MIRPPAIKYELADKQHAISAGGIPRECLPIKSSDSITLSVGRFDVQRKAAFFV